jgi:hypothetical protein
LTTICTNRCVDAKFKYLMLSDGDLRHAINSLQFFFVGIDKSNNVKQPKKKRETKTKTTTKKDAPKPKG